MMVTAEGKHEFQFYTRIQLTTANEELKKFLDGNILKKSIILRLYAIWTS